jgi:hypothetical protein
VPPGFGADAADLLAMDGIVSAVNRDDLAHRRRGIGRCRDQASGGA